jgi:hypothetical protein
MADISNKVLIKEERFILGNPFHGLAIISYLQGCNFINNMPNEVKEENKRTYSLNEGGKISLYYDKNIDTLQVIIHENTPNLIAEDLRNIGKESREKANREKYWSCGSLLNEKNREKHGDTRIY